MKKLALISICVLACLSYTYAQESCYTETRSKGISLYNQKKYDEAINVFEAAKDCPDKPASDDLGEYIRKCKEALAEARKFLRVNGQTSTLDVDYQAFGGDKQFSVSTSASSYDIYGMPSWCSISGRTTASFTLICNENPSTSSRSDYVEIRADGRSVRINIRQSGKVQVKPETGSASTETATIESITVEHDQDVSGEKGVVIHVNFVIHKMKNVKCHAAAYFYDSNSNRLKDTNNAYKSEGGQVSCGKDFVPDYDNARFSDLKLRIPYKELHGTSKGETVMFYVLLWNMASSSAKEIVRSQWQSFTIPSLTYLQVDGNAYEKTSEFDASGGRTSFTVSTSADTYETWGVPSWCSIESKTKNSFTLVCSANNTSETRTDYMKIKADGKEVKINIRQVGMRFAMTGTLRTSYVDNATALPFISNKIDNEKKQCRTGCITEKGGGIVVCDNTTVYTGIPSMMETKLKEVVGNNRISDVCITNNGWWCLVFGRNGYWTVGPQGLSDILKMYHDNKEEIYSVSINDNGDYVVVSDKHIDSSNSSHQDFISEAMNKYGVVRSVSITNLGIVVCCEHGVSYKNIPSKVLEKMKELEGNPQVVRFTDSGTCLVTDGVKKYTFYL